MVRLRAGLVASAGLTVIAVAIALARPEPIAFVIVSGWVALIVWTLLRSLRIVVGAALQRDGIMVRFVLGSPRFARWSELSGAVVRPTSVGRELRILRSSGGAFAVMTERMSAFDELVQAVGAHVPVETHERARAPFAQREGTTPTWTVRTRRPIADARALADRALVAEGFRVEGDDRQVHASAGVVYLEIAVSSDGQGALVRITRRVEAAVLAPAAVSLGFALLALIGLLIGGRTSLLAPVGVALLICLLVAALLWQRAAADRARQGLQAIERALATP